MPNIVLKLVNSLGQKSQIKEFGDKMGFLNWTKAKYDWGNEDSNEDQDLIRDKILLSSILVYLQRS